MQKTNIQKNPFKDFSDYKLPDYTEQVLENSIANPETFIVAEVPILKIEPLFGRPKKKQCKKQ